MQHYSSYTTEDHQVWATLYKRQMDLMPSVAAQAYLDGIQKCGFVEERVPKFTEVNKALMSCTGWIIYVVPGLIDNKPFFEHLSRKEFPATTWLRSMEKLDYLEEPDMFHDTFGHIPLLSNQYFCDYLQGLSDITLAHIDDPIAVEMMARIYWYTVEFGLIKESSETRIYGAGILSSQGECRFALSKDARHLPYEPSKIIMTPYIKDKYQEQYFVIDSYEQLYKSLGSIKRMIEGRYDGVFKAA